MLGAGKGDKRRNSWASFVKFGPRQQLRHGPQHLSRGWLFSSPVNQWAKKRNSSIKTTASETQLVKPAFSAYKMRKKSMKFAPLLVLISTNIKASIINKAVFIILYI